MTIGEDYSHPTPRDWFPRAPKLKPGTTQNRGDELDRGCDRALNNPADQGYVLRATHRRSWAGRDSLRETAWFPGLAVCPSGSE